MREKLKAVLAAVTADQKTEARWLNTVSLMEYVGARKIARTMCQEHPPAIVLDHWADETRHAYAFKRLCEEVSEGACDDYLCKEQAIEFFQALDQGATEWATQRTGVEDTRQNYLLVTTLIEKRAMMVYPLYRSLTERDNVRDELQQVIVEEQDHRVELEEQARALLAERGVDDLDEVFGLERDLFGRFLGQVAETLGLELA